MTRPTNVSPILTPPKGQPLPGPRHRLSDAERMARGRVQIADGDYIEGDEMDAFLGSLEIPASKA